LFTQVKMIYWLSAIDRHWAQEHAGIFGKQLS
jgi:hypothetical protein